MAELLRFLQLRTMKDGDILSESRGRCNGDLRFKKTGDLIRICLREYGSRHEKQLGFYDETGESGLTLRQAREEADKASQQIKISITQKETHASTEDPAPPWKTRVDDNPLQHQFDMQQIAYRVFELIEPAIKQAIAQAIEEHFK